MIPKQIHHVWVGSELPDAQRRHIDTWRQTNPDYELQLWNEDNIDWSQPNLVDAYDKRLWSKVADIARLQAVAKHGGFYLDVDFRLFRSLCPLVQHRCVLSFQTEQSSADWVANGMMGAEPGHWFIELALKRLLQLRSLPFGLERPTRYGPKLITKLLREFGLAEYSEHGVYVEDIWICPTQLFFPWPFAEPFKDEFVTEESYGMHLWEKSWEKDIPALIRVAKKVRRQAIASLRVHTG